MWLWAIFRGDSLMSRVLVIVDGCGEGICRRHYMCLTAGERSVTRGKEVYIRVLPLVGCTRCALKSSR